MSRIGENIKARRIAMGLSVEQLAEILHKSRATVYRYESSDIENMPTNALGPLADALQTSPAELLGWARKEIVTDDEINYLQYYRNRPKAVKDKMLEHLSQQDDNFAKHVQDKADLLDLNKWKKALGIKAVGELLIGRPVALTAEQVEIMAKELDLDACDMYFQPSDGIGELSQEEADIIRKYRNLSDSAKAKVESGVGEIWERDTGGYDEDIIHS